MATPNRVAEIGALVGDPARAGMLTALMDGRALTAGELASVAGIMPQTASSHLAKMVEAQLLHVEKQGRHRYFRLASGKVASLLEGMMTLSSGDGLRTYNGPTGPRDKAMRAARTCYDHMAGGLGVAVTDALLDKGVIEFGDGSGVVLPEGIAFLREQGVALEDAEGRARSSRPLCRPCLDWSERRPHVAGHLGAVLLEHFMTKKLVRRVGETRTLTVTPKGRTWLRDRLDVNYA